MSVSSIGTPPLEPAVGARDVPRGPDRLTSTGVEESLSLLRRAIETPRWDGRFVQVEATLPSPAAGVLPMLFDEFPGEDATYWSEPTGEVSLGLGAAWVTTATGATRFAAVRDAARSLPVRARLFAGFSFHPTAEDRRFTAARALLPRFSVRVSDGGCVLAIWLDRDDHGPQARASLRDQLDRIGSRWRVEGPRPRPLAPQRLAESSLERERFLQLVDAARHQIKRGAFAKVMLHRQTHVETFEARAPGDVLARLERDQPSSTRFAFRVDASTFIGATPERLVRRRGQHIAADVLAGSLPRTLGTETAEVLLHSPKDRSEHELTRQAITEVLRPRCAQLTERGPSVQALPHLFHLHTAIEGTLLAGDHVLDLVEALHPTPAVGGVPRASALAYIHEQEPQDRGWYAGPVGWFSPDGDGDFRVALRCARLRGRSLTLYSGAGIVADSDPSSELSETSAKRRAIALALDLDLSEPT